MDIISQDEDLVNNESNNNNNNNNSSKSIVIDQAEQDAVNEQLKNVAEIGVVNIAWPELQKAIKLRLGIVLENYLERNSDCKEDQYQEPNVEKFNLNNSRDEIYELIASFDEAPFTIQRICELLYSPFKYYDRISTFLRGLEKNLRVISSNDWPKNVSSPLTSSCLNEQQHYNQNDGNNEPLIESDQNHQQINHNHDHEEQEAKVSEAAAAGTMTTVASTAKADDQLELKRDQELVEQHEDPLNHDENQGAQQQQQLKQQQDQQQQQHPNPQELRILPGT